MKISLSFVGDTVKRHRKLCTVALTAVALLGGTVLGVVLERNVGISLSDRLARRMGTTNAQVVSCAKSGSALTVTLEFPNVSQEKEPTSGSPLAKINSPEHVWNMAYYGMALEGVRDELISGPFVSRIDSVTVVCQHAGKTLTTLTGDRVPQHAGVSVDKSGKKILPTPFSNFDIKNADGSDGGGFGMFFLTGSSQPEG